MLKHLYEKQTQPNRVVILGSSGFVASACHRRLRSLDVPVLPLPRTVLDLTNPDAGTQLVRLLEPDDSLLFVAAKAPVKTEEMLIDNLRMAISVCEALRKVIVQQVVYISSDAVYADSDQPLNEKSCAQPGSLHGVMHLAREVMLANAWKGALCFLRPTLIYGVGDPHNGYGPNRFLRQALKGEDISLFGDGEERRDHVWLEDVAELTCRVLLHQSEGILNIATGTVTSFRGIAEQIIRLVPNPLQLKSTPRIGPMPHNGYRAFDCSATLEAFSDFHYTPLKQGLAIMKDHVRS
ncbi:NAD-dependent epimerase/dehydratase family protein [Deltaproteobacteria bacterium TL4]